MRFLLVSLAALLLAIAEAVAADGVDPAAEARAFRGYFIRQIPEREARDFANGPYALNKDMRRQWEEKEQFPPYEFSLEAGKEMFAKPFTNGKIMRIVFSIKASAFGRTIRDLTTRPAK